MKISVILCSYNRSQSLSLALESIAASVMPASDDWCVLIIDNNSQDQTHAAADSFCRRDPAHFRYIFESRQGKSNALNRGIRDAEGDILVFVDDDVTVEPDWLCNLTRPFADPQLAGVGGRIYLPKNFTAPVWLKLDGTESLGGVLALFDLGPAPIPLTIAPVGTNMAFRRNIFAKYGDFRTDLGPQPGSEIRYEDTEFGGRLLKAGEKLLYVPSAIVHHAVAEPRLKQDYYLKYFFNYGRALIRERQERPAIAFIPRPLIGLCNRLFNLLPTKLWYWWKQSDPGKRFFYKCLTYAMLGEIAEMAHSLFSPGTAQRALQPQTGKH